MKYFFLPLLSLPLLCAGQGRDVIYYSVNGKKTDRNASYYYKLAFPGVKSDTTWTYYTSNDKAQSYSAELPGHIKEIVYFFEDGGKESIRIFKDNKATGTWATWYPGGALQREYTHDKSGINLITYNDSTGNSMIRLGEGHCGCFEVSRPALGLGDEVIQLREDGTITKGKRQGKWEGYQNGAHSFDEIYNNGEFVRGIRYLDGKTIDYIQKDKQPGFPGGYGEMMKFLQRTIRYPPASRRSGTQGGVYVAFVVDATGQVRNIEVAKGVAEDLDAEAVRVISAMPKWEPGVLRGVPAAVKYVLPINFKLAR